MKAITIIQPWATLIALGEKKLETRSWRTKYRGSLAIHAGKKVDKDAWIQPVFYDTLRKHGILTVDDLPTGVILAACQLSDCYKITRPFGEESIVQLDGSHESICWGGYPGKEWIFGDYSDGRYAWKLTDIKPFPNPIPAKGMQGLWNWEEPLEHQTEGK